MVHATFRTDPEDKGPDVMDLEPCDLAAFVGITREGKEDGYAYDTCVLIEKELDLEITARCVARGAMKILMDLAGESREEKSLALAGYMNEIFRTDPGVVEEEVFFRAVSLLDQEE